MKSTVKTVKGRGRPLGSKNKATKDSLHEIELLKKEVSNGIELRAKLERQILFKEKSISQFERDLERKDHTLEIMRDEIKELEKQVMDQKEKNSFLELDINHLKDIIKRLVEHLWCTLDYYYLPLYSTY